MHCMDYRIDPRGTRNSKSMASNAASTTVTGFLQNQRNYLVCRLRDQSRVSV